MNKKVFLLIGTLLSTGAFAAIEKCDPDILNVAKNSDWKTTGKVEANATYTFLSEALTAIREENTNLNSISPLKEEVQSCTWEYMDESNQKKEITYSRTYTKEELEAPSVSPTSSAGEMQALSSGSTLKKPGVYSVPRSRLPQPIRKTPVNYPKNVSSKDYVKQSNLYKFRNYVGQPEPYTDTDMKYNK